MDEEKVYLILSVVGEVPFGKVASYGQIARIAGYPKNARLVGKIMSHASLYGAYPCHRIVRSDGHLAEGWPEQEQLLVLEGVEFKKSRVVDMKKYMWDE